MAHVYYCFELAAGGGFALIKLGEDGDRTPNQGGTNGALPFLQQAAKIRDSDKGDD